MVAQPDIKYTIGSTPPLRNQRYSSQENLQRPWYSLNQVTHNKPLKRDCFAAPQLNRYVYKNMFAIYQINKSRFIKIKYLTFLSLIIPVVVFGQECDVVAKVFSENICRSEITTSYKKEVIKLHKNQSEQRKLIHRINEIAINNLIEKESYKINENDIELFLTTMREKRMVEKKWRERAIITIKYLLKNYKYEEKYLNRLKKGLETQENFIKSIKHGEDNDALRENNPEFKERMDSEIEESITKTKINIAIIEKYGSFSTFDKEIKTKGKIIILDNSFIKVLADLEQNAAAYDRNIPLLINLNYIDEEQYVKMINSYKKLPHLHPDMDELW